MKTGLSRSLWFDVGFRRCQDDYRESQPLMLRLRTAFSHTPIEHEFLPVARLSRPRRAMAGSSRSSVPVSMSEMTCRIRARPDLRVSGDLRRPLAGC